MYKRILAPIDGSHTSTRGLQEAVELAKAEHAVLRLVHVVDESAITLTPELAGTDATHILDALVKSGKQVMRNAVSLAERHGVSVESSTHETFVGRVADVILKEAKEWHADLIVMGTHGRRGLTHAVMGSDAEAVVRSSPVPVLLVRSPQ